MELETNEDILREAKDITEFEGRDLRQWLYREILLNALKTKKDELDILDLKVVSRAMDEFRYQRSGATGKPLCYGLIGYELELGPVPDDTYSVEITFYQKFTPLSDSATTNWILDSHPDLYLYGSLMHSSPYLMDDPRIAIWKGLMEERLQELSAQDEQGENPGTTLNMSIKRPYFSGAVTNPIYYR